MPTSVKKKGSAARLSRSAVLLALAMALSYLEYLLPLSLLLPLPGVKLGLSNLVITAAFFLISPVDAALISLSRVVLSSLLFGSFSSFLFSLFGGVLAYLLLFPGKKLLLKTTYIGVSVVCAAGHEAGQILAAVLLYGTGVFFSYLPVLLLAGTVTGTLVGVLLNVLVPTLGKLLKEEKTQ